MNHTADTPAAVGFRPYPPEKLIALGRCPDCSFDPPTQGHREGCQHTQLGADAYRAGRCKTWPPRSVRTGAHRV